MNLKTRTNNIPSNLVCMYNMRPVQLSKVWRHVSAAKPDPIMGITELYNSSNNPNKINLSVGAYKDEYGNPYIFDSVKRAKDIIHKDKSNNHEYIGILGCNKLRNNSLKLAIGELVDTELFATTQTVSGTGSLRIAGEFLYNFYNPDKRTKIYVPNPTWSNHINIFNKCNIDIDTYSYINNDYDIDIYNMVNEMKKMPDKSIILMHTCCHNPSGMDLTTKEWKMILNVIKNKEHFILFDMAYQGFASGNMLLDARPIRFAYILDIPFMLCQSYSKNFGLYGERVGCLSISSNNIDEKNNIESQLKQIIRPMYSNPPINGAKIVNTILGNNDLYRIWIEDCYEISNRIKKVRMILKNKLDQELPQHDWSHIIKQNGMFSYTKINEDVIKTLINDYDIYMTNDGRISISSLNSSNIDYFVESIKNISNSMDGNIIR